MSSWHEAIPPFVIVGAAFVAASYALDFTHKLTHNGKVCKFPFRISTFSDTLLTLSPLFASAAMCARIPGMMRWPLAIPNSLATSIKSRMGLEM